MVMNLSKCIKIFFSLFLCFLLFTGCTGSRHLKDLFIVEGLGIDYYDNNLSVTLQGLKVNVSVMLFVMFCVGFGKFAFTNTGNSAKKNMPVFLKHGI